MARQQPRLSTQIGTNALGKTTIAVKERQPSNRIPITTKDVVGADGQIDMEKVCRVMNMMQDNVHAATAQSRNDPTANKTIVQVVMTKGSPVQVRHGLGAFVGHWFPTRAFPGSQPFQAVEAQFGSSQWPNSLDQTQWIVLIPSSTGTYNVAFCPA